MQKLNFSITILSKVLLIQSFKLLGGDALYFSRRCVYKKRQIKKIRSEEETFSTPKNGNFLIFFVPDIVNTLFFKTITLVCQKTRFNVYR
jgi:hypothetical protein